MRLEGDRKSLFDFCREVRRLVVGRFELSDRNVSAFVTGVGRLWRKGPGGEVAVIDLPAGLLAQEPGHEDCYRFDEIRKVLGKVDLTDIRVRLFG